MEALDTVELPESVNSPRLSSQTSFPAVSVPQILRKPPQEKWVSSLAPADLRCLLSVLEVRLIPQLVHGYAPSMSAPLSPDRFGD